jgi:RNA polymerase sigma factor (sigma-70 family)
VAQAAVVDQFGPLIIKIVNQVCHKFHVPPQDWPDVVNEAYHQILSPKIVRFSPSLGKPSTYFLGIVKNAARKAQTFNGNRCRNSNQDAEAADSIGRLRLKARGMMPRFAAADQSAEETDTVDYVMRAAPLHLQRAIRLRYWEGRSLEAVAGDLGVNRFALARELESFFRKMNARLGDEFRTLRTEAAK